MWNPASTGVFLQRIETPESNKIVLKILRKPSGAGYADLAEETVTVLNFNPNDTEEYSLQFDPWSDINVVADGSIDEKDINVITRLALEFRDQTAISSDSGVFLEVTPVEDKRLLVLVSVLDLEDFERPEFNYRLNATSSDKGESFSVRRINPDSDPAVNETPGLENLIKAFIKLRL